MKLNLPSLLTRLRSNTTSSGTAGRWKGSLSRYAAAAPSKILARSSRSVASDPGSLQQQFELMPNLLNSAMVWPALMDSLRMPLQLSSSADVIGFVEEADCYKINGKDRNPCMTLILSLSNLDLSQKSNYLASLPTTSPSLSRTTRCFGFRLRRGPKRWWARASNRVQQVG